MRVLGWALALLPPNTQWPLTHRIRATRLTPMSAFAVAIGGKADMAYCIAMSAFDPKRTSGKHAEAASSKATATLRGGYFPFGQFQRRVRVG